LLEFEEFKEGSRMSQPYVGEVRAVGFNFAPADWAFCQGQILAISTNTTLFNLIGTTFGGNGTTTFSLPDLRGRVPVHQGSSGGGNYVMGQLGGVESVTIVGSTYPQHTHTLAGSTNPGNVSNPANNASGSGYKIYGAPADSPIVPMNPAMVGYSGGGNLPHDNRQPYIALNWVISLFGIFPTAN
jgi:microcystin-dependent protein